MAAVVHTHVKHQPRKPVNRECSMSSASGDRLPSYLPDDELDACLNIIPSTNQENLLHQGLINPERFNSSDEYGDLYRSSSSNRRMHGLESLSRVTSTHTGYPSYLPESDDEKEVDSQLSSAGRAQDTSCMYKSPLSANTKLQARSGRQLPSKTETRKPLNGVKKSVTKQLSQGENRSGKISQDWQGKEQMNLSSGLGSLSSYLSNSVEDEGAFHAFNNQKGTTDSSVYQQTQQGFHVGTSIHESVGRQSLTQSTQSGSSIDSCQSAKTAFAQELKGAKGDERLTKANSKDSDIDQAHLSSKEYLYGPADGKGLTASLRKNSKMSSGIGSSSPQQQMSVSAALQSPIQTHTNTPPIQIPMASATADDGSSTVVGSCGNSGQSLGPASGWSFQLPGNGMRGEVPKSKSTYGASVQKDNKERSLLHSLLPGQSTSPLSEEELVNQAKIIALTRLVQEKPSYMDSDPESLWTQISAVICPNQDNEPAGRTDGETQSMTPMSLRSMISQSLGSLGDMLSIASTMTSCTGAGKEPANQPQHQNPSSQSGLSMINQLVSTIFISQSEASAGTTNEQRELLSALQSANTRQSLVQASIQLEQLNLSHTVREMMENAQQSKQHRHARLLDVLEQLSQGSQGLKQVLVGAAYCYGRCQQPNCMLASEVLSDLVECVKERTVLRCRGCKLVLSDLLEHHVPRCTERRCLVPYCVHLQTSMPLSVEKAVEKINSETSSALLCAEIVTRTTGDPNFLKLAKTDPAVSKLEPVLPLGTFGRNILARAQGKYFTVKQMDGRCLEVLRRLDRSTPNIVQFFWVQSAEHCQGELQVCTAFEQGGSLQSLLTECGGLKTDRMWVYLQQVLQAVRYLHSMDIVYLAWTADNIVLDSSHQQVKLSNLSYAVQLSDEPDEEACVQAVTGLPPQILAPEVHTDLSACHKADIWGLGCLMYQLMEGRLPYPHLSHEHPDSIRQKIGEEGELPQIPESWDGKEKTWLEACWKKDPSKRPSAQELQACISTVQHH